MVYEFCDKFAQLWPSKGSSQRGLRRYRKTQGSTTATLYEIGTGFYKDIIYRNLTIKRHLDGTPAGFMDHPIGYPEEYYSQLTAERVGDDGLYYKIRPRNEALDVKVLNIAANDIWLDIKVREYQELFKDQGVSEDDIKRVNARYVLTEYAKRLGV
jgi:phage terminase large subunit GpA-like protein